MRRSSFSKSDRHSPAPTCSPSSRPASTSMLTLAGLGDADRRLLPRAAAVPDRGRPGRRSCARRRGRCSCGCARASAARMARGADHAARSSRSCCSRRSSSSARRSPTTRMLWRSGRAACIEARSARPAGVGRRASADRRARGRLLGQHGARHGALIAELRKYVEPLRKFALASGITVVGALLQLALVDPRSRSSSSATARRSPGACAAASQRHRRRRAASQLATRRDRDGARRRARHPRHGARAGRARRRSASGSPASRRRRCSGFITFLLSPVPVGPPLVWMPAGLWLINIGETGWGIFVLLWGALVVSTIDNIIKPLIISARQRPAVRAGAARRAGRRDRVRLHRRVPRAGAAGRRLRAAEGVGGARGREIEAPDVSVERRDRR